MLQSQVAGKECLFQAGQLRVKNYGHKSNAIYMMLQWRIAQGVEGNRYCRKGMLVASR